MSGGPWRSRPSADLGRLDRPANGSRCRAHRELLKSALDQAKARKDATQQSVQRTALQLQEAKACLEQVEAEASKGESLSQYVYSQLSSGLAVVEEGWMGRRIADADLFDELCRTTLLVVAGTKAEAEQKGQALNPSPLTLTVPLATCHLPPSPVLDCLELQAVLPLVDV